MVFVMLISANTAPGQPPKDDFQKIIDRYQQSVLHTDPEWSTEKSSTADKTKIHRWAAALGADGAWPDIDYASQDRSFWQVSHHLDRIRILARALLDPDISSREKEQIESATFRALDFWLAKRFKNSNWWWNQIGVPQAMCDIIALLGDRLTGDRRTQALEVLAQFGKPKSNDGANTMWIADLALQYGAFTRNAAAVAEASQIIAGEIKITSGDGIQSDYSFHQHGARLQQFAYGRSYLLTSARIAWQLDGTPWSLPQAKLELLADLILESDQWMCRGIDTVPATLDRSFSRPGALTAADIRTSTEQLNKLVPDRASELKTFLARQNGSGKLLVGARTFPRSDFAVFHRPAFSFFIKTLSDRTLPAEVGLNAENLKGTLQDDGDSYLVRDGQEYFNLAPVWDWDLLPGVTFARGAGKPQRQSFVGAVTGGSSCTVVMDFDFNAQNKTSLSGEKFWACHGDTVICLISDLSAPEIITPVRTALDQCRLRGQVTICDDSGKQRVVTGSETNISLRWVQHSGFAYAPLDHLKASISAKPVTNSWSSINKALSTDSVTVPVFLAVLEHGTAPQRAAGGFVITPAATPTDAERIFQHPSWRVVRNDAALQAVEFSDGTIAAAFHEPEELAWNGAKLTVDKPCILLTQRDRAWICDPTQQGGRLRFGVKDKIHEVDLPAQGASAIVVFE